MNKDMVKAIEGEETDLTEEGITEEELIEALDEAEKQNRIMKNVYIQL